MFLNFRISELSAKAALNDVSDTISTFIPCQYSRLSNPYPYSGCCHLFTGLDVIPILKTHGYFLNKSWMDCSQWFNTLLAVALGDLQRWKMILCFAFMVWFNWGKISSRKRGSTKTPSGKQGSQAWSGQANGRSDARERTVEACVSGSCLGICTLRRETSISSCDTLLFSSMFSFSKLVSFSQSTSSYCFFWTHPGSPSESHSTEANERNRLTIPAWLGPETNEH